MSINNVNNQNLQAIYDNLTQLSKELNGMQDKTKEMLFDKKQEVFEDEFVSTTTLSSQNTTENASNLNVLTNLIGNFIDNIKMDNISEIQSVEALASQLTDEMPTVVNKTRQLDSVSGISNDSQSVLSDPDSKKTIKTMDEYMEILDEKYADLFEKLDGMTWVDALHTMRSSNLRSADGKEISDTCERERYTAEEYFDADGDGRISSIDLMIWKNYLLKYQDSVGGATKAGFTGKGRGISTLCGLLQGVITSNQYGTSYDLNDLEQIEMLISTSKYSSSLPTNLAIAGKGGRKFNINEIAKDPNWEEKLNNSTILKKYMTKEDFKQLKQTIKDAQEYMENHPETSQYAAIAASYNIYKSNCCNVQKTIENGYLYIAHTPEYRAKMKLTEEEAQNQDNGNILRDKYKDCLVYAADFTGNGKINFEDINAISDEIDLDGDGVISQEERNYIKALKLFMYENAGRYRSCCTLVETADNCINYLQYKESEPAVTEIENDKKKAISEGLKAFNYDEKEYMTEDGLYRSTGFDPYYNGMKTMGGMNLGQQTRRTAAYGKYGIVATTGTTTYDDFILNLKAQLLYSDLTKEELQEILNKINAASSNVQCQLAQVKSAVAAKLANK